MNRILDGALVPEYTPYPHDPAFDRQAFVFFPFGQASYAPAPFLSGAITDNQPVRESPRTHDGKWIPFFFGDYYNRVHIDPPTLALGNLLNDQRREIEIWNAYTEREKLLEVDADGDGNIKFAIAPTLFLPLESRIYELVVRMEGAPTIDARYTLKFQHIKIVFLITGRRVVVWPFVPLGNYTESLEWLTDVIKTRRAERRLSLRRNPRQGFSLDYVLAEQQFSRAKILLDTWRHRTFGVPIWGDATNVGGIPGNPQALSLDTTDADYRENGMILIYQSDTAYEAAETTTVNASRIDLKIPVAGRYTDAWVMPLRSGSMTENTFDRPFYRLAKTHAEFMITDGADLGSDTEGPRYLGSDVLLDCPLIDVSESFARDVETIDNQLSDILRYDVEAYTRHRQQMKWFAPNRKQERRIREWLHARMGRQASFWFPSFNRDFAVTATIASTATAITVENVGYHLFGAIRDIVIFTANGHHFARITGAADNGDGTETLALESAIGTELRPEQINKVSVMKRCRLDSDRVEIEHTFRSMSKITVPLITVEDEQ